MKKTLVVSLFSIYLLFTSCSQHPGDELIDDANVTEIKNVKWSYEEETGPEHWGELLPEYILCKNGAEQSPINIQETIVGVNESLSDLKINYHSTTVSLNNNGNRISITDVSKNNTIELSEKTYKLNQIHIHTPSEHQLNSQHYEMELHFLHEDKRANLVVFAVFVQEGSEKESLAELITNLSQQKLETEVQLNQTVDLLSMLPNDFTTFRYDGSLTTPPCTERVKWLVFEQPIEMSKEQIAAFQAVISENNRPIQPQNEREIAKKHQ
ncbi:carbonic anhydrase [Bacillus taeanensis]|uniref:Carbonic anhydrase n=1 Tax=Bacillus taeanensis TaxID=273032 RepID=A0A366XZH3_9BACI|nr:carbonic anhydrase family protein [Bacillus taeanensis]RBW71006.1 carbonic anhydrase [Bacillus taeanensis]